MPFGLSAYRTLTRFAAPALPLVLKRRLRAGKEHPTRWRERLGEAGVARPPGPLIWLHGASVGEGLSLLPLVEALLAARPGLTVLVTTGTVTSAELLGKRLPPRSDQGGAIHQFAPVDAPGVATRFLDHWRPDAAIFVESEIWPNLLTEARRRGIRTALISARLSVSSLRGWARMAASARAVLGRYDLVLSQDEATATGLTALGARDDGKLNLKLAGEAPPVDPEALAELRAAAAGRPVLLAASTHPGEDEIVLDAFLNTRGPNGLLVIAPRHPARAAEIVLAARTRSYDAAVRTHEPFGAAQVYVADTFGELGLWYSLAVGCFVGGSLVEGPGGHNPLEPAKLGCPQVSGPYRNNWEAIYAVLGDEAPVVTDAPSLAAAFHSMLCEPDIWAARASAARIAAEAGTALDQAVAAILTLAGRASR